MVNETELKRIYDDTRCEVMRSISALGNYRDLLRLIEIKAHEFGEVPNNHMVEEMKGLVGKLTDEIIELNKSHDNIFGIPYCMEAKLGGDEE